MALGTGGEFPEGENTEARCSAGSAMRAQWSPGGRSAQLLRPPTCVLLALLLRRGRG